MNAPDVVRAVRSELRKLPAELQDGPLAEAALMLAGMLPEASPRDAATLNRELRLTLAELRQLADAMAPEEVDPVDELAQRRAARLSTPVPDGPARAAERR